MGDKREYEINYDLRKLLGFAECRTGAVKKALRAAEKEAKSFPEGRLRISTSGKQCRYYELPPGGDKFGKYIPVGEAKLAKALAQKDYNIQFCKRAKEELGILERFIKQEKYRNADLAFSELAGSRKALVNPYLLSDELFAKQWQEEHFPRESFYTESKLFDTKRCEKVRSKSEAILADIFYDYGIPYHYEKPLYLKSGETKYPDFTLLDVKRRKELYWEHLGLLDDYEYRISNLKKLDKYRENGIYTGKNLIITFEMPEVPLDIKGIRSMVEEIFEI